MEEFPAVAEALRVDVFLQSHLFVISVCRILKMMHTISAHASENRMTPSAVAACMAPLLLHPLLAGEYGSVALASTFSW